MIRRARWWVLTKLHRPFIHRTAEKPCWLCNLAWRDLLTLQAFVEELNRATEDMEAGRSYRWSEVRRELP